MLVRGGQGRGGAGPDRGVEEGGVLSTGPHASAALKPLWGGNTSCTPHLPPHASRECPSARLKPWCPPARGDGRVSQPPPTHPTGGCLRPSADLPPQHRARRRVNITGVRAGGQT